MTVRAKFIITKIERTLSHRKNEEGNYVPAELWTIHGNPVYGNQDPNHENTRFWQASPSGSLALGTVNPEAVKEFDVGKEFYVDFTLAVPPTPNA